MSFLGTAKKLINIVDWFTGKYENVKTWIKKWNRRRIARSIRGAVDGRDAPVVAKRVRNVLKKRRDRADSD